MKGTFLAFKDIQPTGKKALGKVCISSREYWFGTIISVPGTSESEDWRVRRFYPIDAKDGYWRTGNYDETVPKPEVDEVDVVESDLLWTSIEWRQAQEKNNTMNGMVKKKGRAVTSSAGSQHDMEDIERVFRVEPGVHALVCLRL
mgnify:CR=1 FL=1